MPTCPRTTRLEWDLPYLGIEMSSGVAVNASTQYCLMKQWRGERDSVSFLVARDVIPSKKVRLLSSSPAEDDSLCEASSKLVLAPVDDESEALLTTRG